MTSAPSSSPRGRLSRKLLGAFFLIVAVLVAAGMIVTMQVTSRSLETRAEGQLVSDAAIVRLTLLEIEEQVTFYSGLLASTDALTEQLGHSSVTRSLMISLLGDLRRNRMDVHLHREVPSDTSPGSDLVRRGFLGIRATGLTLAGDGDEREASVIGVAPIESTLGVERVVTVAFPLTSGYLGEIRRRIGSDITIVLPGDRVLTTLRKEVLASLLPPHGRVRLVENLNEPFLVASASSLGPAKTRVSPFRIDMKREGWLLLTMPMDDLLAAKRSIFRKGLLVTAGLLSVASLLYLPLIRRITRPLDRLSRATHDIAEGDLDLRVEVATRDEVGELAHSFNVMVERLRESRAEIEEWNRKLERRVEARTRSLQEAQRELERVNRQLVRAMDELRETQAQMIQTEKLAAVGQMASTMAHEIKNPLAGMRAALELVLDDLAKRPEAQVLDRVLDQVDRLGRTTGQLLTFARPAEPRREATRLEELIEDTRFLIGQQARRDGVSIRIDLEKSDRSLDLDPQLTTQAFLNIMLNALQAMAGDGTLTISSRRDAEGKGVEVAFADTGPGMPPEVLEKIFTPFFTTKSQGTGLGLHVVREIVERQGGRVLVTSTPGEGTRVVVWLPYGSQEGART